MQLNKQVARLCAGAILSAGFVSTASAGVCLVTSDPAGPPDSILPHLDILALSLGTDGGDVTMQVDFALPLDLNTQGSIRTTLAVSEDRVYWLGADFVAPTVVTYAYGEYYLDETTGFYTYAETGEGTGSVSGSSVTVVAPLSGLGGISGPVTASANAQQAIGILLMTNDSTEDAPYTVGESCSKAESLSAANDSGVAPFEAVFDASQTNGAVQAYHFDFGDGSELTSATPHVSHVYQVAGDYTATVRPVSESGLKGEAAQTTVAVSEAANAAGSLGWLLLCMAGLLGLRRKR